MVSPPTILVGCVSYFQSSPQRTGRPDSLVFDTFFDSRGVVSCAALNSGLQPVFLRYGAFCILRDLDAAHLTKPSIAIMLLTLGKESPGSNLGGDARLDAVLLRMKMTLFLMINNNKITTTTTTIIVH